MARATALKESAPTVGTLQTLPAIEENDRYAPVAKEAPFSKPSPQ